MNDLGNATLIDTHDDRVVVIGGSDDISKIYYIKQNLWLDNLRTPIPFRSNDLQKVELLNGNSVIFKTNYTDSNNFMVYNIKDGTLQEVIDTTVNNTEPTTAIVLKTGDIIRVSLDPDTGTNYISKFY
jgi:hypothetical protein